MREDEGRISGWILTFTDCCATCWHSHISFSHNSRASSVHIVSQMQQWKTNLRINAQNIKYFAQIHLCYGIIILQNIAQICVPEINLRPLTNLKKLIKVAQISILHMFSK